VIRIHKPLVPPNKLAQDGKRKRRSHCSSYSRNPTAYQSGEKTFSFDGAIYAHVSVKQALIESQHSKCCFCERLISTDGDVEHFRPKQAYKQAAGEPLQRPGYYWLAYDWSNLYLACTGCNQRHKQNLFPLQNPGDRATTHHADITLEKPLLIDPGSDNPEELIGFRGEIAYAVDGNARGQVTLDALKLNERSIPESRRRQLARLKVLHELVQEAAKCPENTELQKLSEKAKDNLEKAVQDDAEFSAVFRCAIQSNFQFVIG
jgi:uncharacterized protein (TIGR02646 family)